MASRLARLSRRPRKGCPSKWADPRYGFQGLFGSLPSQRSYAIVPRIRDPLFKQSRSRECFGLAGACSWLLQAAPFSKQIDVSQNKSLGQEAGAENKSEAISVSWVHRFLPSRILPFALLARLDKPIGTWLLAWPCMWSIALATPAGHLPDFKLVALFGAGAILLRGAGCTVNDLLDQDIDCKVERTKLRPIACGAVTPFQGLTFLGLQLLLGLGILVQLNTFSQVLGASSLLFVGTYPLFKRWTYWPQAFLGLTFNWGALLGWAAVKGSIDVSVVAPLYLAGICWTLVYDTIYAHQDKYDDIKVGVKSTALYFGQQTKLWLSGFGVVAITSLIVAGHNGDLGWIFHSSLLGAAAHLYWQISTVDLQSRADCNLKFVSNKWFGAIVFAGIASAKLFG